MPRTIFSLFISYFASKNDYFLENLAYMQKKAYFCADFRKLTGFFGAIAKKIKQILDITGRDKQPYLYNGKEFVEAHGWNAYDYGFRGYRRNVSYWQLHF